MNLRGFHDLISQKQFEKLCQTQWCGEKTLTAQAHFSSIIYSMNWTSQILYMDP